MNKLFYFILIKGLRQHYVKLRENEKNRKLIDLLDKLEFNQVVIFVKSVPRCTALCKLLTEQNFPAVDIHRGRICMFVDWTLVLLCRYKVVQNATGTPSQLRHCGEY